MTLPLDVRSIALTCGVVHLAVAWVTTYVWLRRKTYPGFAFWTLSGWCFFFGIMIIVFRGLLPDLLTIVVANVLLMGGAIANQAGLIVFSGGRPRFLGYALFLAVFAAGLILFTHVHLSLLGRVVIVSAAVSFFTLRSAYIAWRKLGRESRLVNPVVVTTLAAVGLLYLGRTLATLLWPPPSNDYMAPSFLQGVALLAYLAAQTVLGVSLVVLNGQRLEQELLQSIEECKVLRGIIPICAYCKKIRNDEGAWDQVEHYIRKHTDATFSHSICPECAAVELEKIAQRSKSVRM